MKSVDKQMVQQTARYCDGCLEALLTSKPNPASLSALPLHHIIAHTYFSFYHQLCHFLREFSLRRDFNAGVKYLACLLGAQTKQLTGITSVIHTQLLYINPSWCSDSNWRETKYVMGPLVSIYNHSWPRSELSIITQSTLYNNSRCKGIWMPSICNCHAIYFFILFTNLSYVSLRFF